MAPNTRQMDETRADSPNKRSKRVTSTDDSSAGQETAFDPKIWKTSAVKDPQAIRKAIEHTNETVDNKEGNSTKGTEFTVNGNTSTMVFKNVFNDDLLRQARSQLLQLSFKSKVSETSSFSSIDNLNDPTIVPADSAVAKIRDAIYSRHFLKFLQEATGSQYSDRIELSAHMFRRGEFSGCDNDEKLSLLEYPQSRREAFVIYLNPEWSDSFGGRLVMFEIDSVARPIWVAQRIRPSWNKLVIFEVNPASFYEVEEVTVPSNRDLVHLSIRGWIYGPTNIRDSIGGFSNVWDQYAPKQLFEKFVNADHLEFRQKVHFHNAFAEHKIIQISDFLRPDIFQRVCTAMDASFDKHDTTPFGPVSIRRFFFLPEKNDSEISGTSEGREDFLLQQLFKTTPFRNWLEDITSLDLKVKTRQHRVQRRLFTQGSYSLNTKFSQDPDGLDVILSLGNGTSDPWNAAWGGALKYTTWTTTGEFEQSLIASPNVLTIVLRKSDTYKSIERVNCNVEGGMEGRADVEAVYSLPEHALQ